MIATYITLCFYALIKRAVDILISQCNFEGSCVQTCKVFEVVLDAMLLLSLHNAGCLILSCILRLSGFLRVCVATKYQNYPQSGLKPTELSSSPLRRLLTSLELYLECVVETERQVNDTTNRI
jgi:hypothetical protein